MWRGLLLVAVSLVVVPVLSCRGAESRALAPRSQTWAELRVVRRAVTVRAPDDPELRAPYARERLVDGEIVHVEEGGLAWLRRDGGATLLVRGPAELTLRSDRVEVARGRVFIDTPSAAPVELTTPSGPLHLAHVRASLEVQSSTELYVLAGEVRTESSAHAGPGERMTLEGSGSEARAKVAPVVSWDDWTGGLATTDRDAAPAPFGVGTVGARRAGEQGTPRSPLAIQRLDLRVRIDGDFAVTEVDEVFFNASSDTVEGLYRFRTPDGAVLERFGVDREGAVVWGRVKEKAAAAAQYQANVYQGSTEDPALLEWDAPGVYQARLYPIGPGEARRVVVSYAEWLGRTGEKATRRLYVYPMAAEGPEESAPRIEELSAAFDLGRAGATEVRAGMAGVREGDTLFIRAHDLVPRADLAVELFDRGPTSTRGYQASEVVDLQTIAPSERAQAEKRASTEAPFVLVPVTASQVAHELSPARGLDFALVIDTSAATEPASLAVARAATRAMLAHLGPEDRVVVWAGDSTLRPVVAGRDKLAKLDDGARKDILAGLGGLERGGSTDLGAMLAAAAQSLDSDPTRRGAVVYLGDGAPTVGELSAADLGAHLAKLPRPVRVFALGIGDSVEMGILGALARGAFAERVGDGNAAARAALRVLEVAERPAFLGVTVDLGPTVERIYPRDLGALVDGEAQVVVGRLAGAAPTSMTLKTTAGSVTTPLKVAAFEDHGDLSRRWANGRLAQMIEEGVGRAAMVDLGSRHGIITPVTSLYVPTKSEMSPEEKQALAAGKDALRQHTRRRFAEHSEEESKDEGATADKKEGDTGTRGKGGEAPAMRPESPSYVRSHGAAQAAPAAPATLGLIGQVAPPAASAAPSSANEPNAPAAPWALDATPQGDPSAPRGNAFGADIGGGGLDGRNMVRAPAAIVARVAPTALPPSPAKPATLVARPAQEHRSKPAGEVPTTLAAADNSGVDFDRAQISQTVAVGGRAVIVLGLGDVAHIVSRCGGAADLPFEERALLWKERLSAVTGNIGAVAGVYRSALASCEAPTWRERSRLVSLMLDVVPTVAGKVALWRAMFGEMGASDALYRGLLARVRSTTELRQLHEALGLKSIDGGVLTKLLADAKTPEGRVKKLRALVREWPDDFALALRLLDELEDLGDEAGARGLARTLRARPDADARVRTAVGELYLRLGGRSKEPAARAADEAEARRAFGEIVEFAPDDPIARRRLGDLLRAHGWFAEAARQYETLAHLTPDDSSVGLLLGSAAQGMGRLEEAVRWTEKGGQAGAPDADGSAGRSARALAATWLGWGRAEALASGRADEAKLLAARLERVLSHDPSGTKPNEGPRVTLTWSHPELHPTLWTNALGAPMPAPEGDPTLGVAAASLPSHGGVVVEVRLDPEDTAHAARLHARAVLTTLFDGPDGRVVVTPIDFTNGRSSRSFAVEGDDVKEVAR